MWVVGVGSRVSGVGEEPTPASLIDHRAHGGIVLMALGPCIAVAKAEPTTETQRTQRFLCDLCASVVIGSSRQAALRKFTTVDAKYAPHVRTSNTSDDDMKHECVQWHSLALIEARCASAAGENQSLPKS